MKKYFNYHKGEGFIEGCRLSALAEKYGTPLYVYSEKTIRESVQRFQKAFSKIAPIIRYSCKANSNLHLLKILKETGCGADVISPGELTIALAAGFAPQDIVMGGVGKGEDEIEFGLKKGVSFFSVESLPELATLNRLSSKQKGEITALLRLNPDIAAGGHRYISTGKREDKFGLTEAEVVSVLKKPSDFPHLKIGGLHFHLGSQIDSPEPYLKAIKEAERLHKIYPFQFLDLGGGFPVTYDKEMAGIEVFGKAICGAVKKMGLQIIFEPGRHFIAPAGFLLTRIIYRKNRPHKRFLVVDAGMNDLIRPSLYEAWHNIRTVRELKGKKNSFEIVGPVCESGDFLGKERLLPDTIKEGDLLLIGEAGAYGFAMSSNYNGRLRPAEVLVTGKKSRIIRKRETLANLTEQFT
ncbi:MAG: diaminopimelate decarboxylase [Candidatus Omnitrophica bacterium]|nr:diaminopimelate decarboxylase [Candidatus Omnitrophota bacterium]